MAAPGRTRRMSGDVAIASYAHRKRRRSSREAIVISHAAPEGNAFITPLSMGRIVPVSTLLSAERCSKSGHATHCSGYRAMSRGVTPTWGPRPPTQYWCAFVAVIANCRQCFPMCSASLRSTSTRLNNNRVPVTIRFADAVSEVINQYYRTVEDGSRPGIGFGILPGDSVVAVMS